MLNICMYSRSIYIMYITLEKDMQNENKEEYRLYIINK